VIGAVCCGVFCQVVQTAQGCRRCHARTVAGLPATAAHGGECASLMPPILSAGGRGGMMPRVSSPLCTEGQTCHRGLLDNALLQPHASVKLQMIGCRLLGRRWGERYAIQGAWCCPVHLWERHFLTLHKPGTIWQLRRYEGWKLHLTMHTKRSLPMGANDHTQLIIVLRHTTACGPAPDGRGWFGCAAPSCPGPQSHSPSLSPALSSSSLQSPK
jgi:hypothetical protein